MTDTVVSSATREVVIGFERPFVVIGERINPTGRKLLAREMAADNYERVISDAIAQVEAGAHMLDVNAGIPLADEPRILAETVQLVQSLTDVPLSIDSSIVEALEAGDELDLLEDTHTLRTRTLISDLKAMEARVASAEKKHGKDA